MVLSGLVRGLASCTYALTLMSTLKLCCPLLDRFSSGVKRHLLLFHKQLCWDTFLSRSGTHPVRIPILRRAHTSASLVDLKARGGWGI